MIKVVSILLTVLLLFSSTGITYAQHFCGSFEMMAKITLGEEQMSCEMVVIDDCGAEDDKEGHGCCDNLYTSVDVDDNFASSSFEMQIDPTVAIAMISVFVLVQEVTDTVTNTFYVDYSPPPLGDDFLVLYETFLI